jgi:stage V sporulation protein R
LTPELEKRFEEIHQLALKMGLDPFPISWEEVPREIIWDTASYGLPTRMSHWSFGRSFLHQKINGEMGFSKIYELIINSNPSVALLDETNDDVTNLLICAHCYLPGTYIQTHDGLKPIEACLKGDKVFNYKGELTKVNKPTSRHFNGDIVRIQAGAYSFSQTDDHQLYVVKTSPTERRQHRSWKKAFERTNYAPQWIKSKDIKAGDFLVVNKPKTSDGTMSEIEIKVKKHRWKQHVNTSLKVNLDYEFGTLIGLYLAEGYGRVKGQMGLCFHTDEKELHALSKKLVRKYFGLDCYEYSDTETHSMQICFNEICTANYLRENLGTKCHQKRIPEQWMAHAPLIFLKGILKGYLLGDGDKKAPRTMGYSTTSPLLAMQIQNIAMMNGIFIGICPRNRSTKEQPRRISFIGQAAGIYDNEIRSLLDMPKRKLSRTWSGVIEKDHCFYIKVNEVEINKYSGLVHCLNVQEGSSFTLANGIITHNCIGHSDFFKNNLLFAPTNRNMVNQAEANAKTIESFKDKYGIDVVEDWMDIGFSIDNHIDWHRGENRHRYPEPEHVFNVKNPLPYADIFGEDMKPQVTEEIKNTDFPPHKEKDLLWFLVNYASKMLPWQKEVLSIIRSEAFYFYPQGQTKIINEGWASFWHAELMLNYENLTPEDHLRFSKTHSSIIRPGGGGQLNPYYIGFRILTDVKKRWDKYYEEGKKDAAFQKLSEIDHYDKNGKVVMSKMTGYQKLFQIRREDDDISFISNYLTRDLCEDMDLFVAGLAGLDDDPEEDDIIIKDKELDAVQRTMVSRLHNGGSPLIYVSAADETALYLQHNERDATLDPLYAKKTLEYVFEIWKRTVILLTHDDKESKIYYKIGREGITEEVDGDDGSSSRKFQI